jgi:hypothetical protein
LVFGLEIKSFPDVADVTVALSPDEGLLLFELLHRWEDAGWYDTADLLVGERDERD